MTPELTVILVNIVLLVIFIVAVLLLRKFLWVYEKHTTMEQKEANVEKILNKFVSEEKREEEKKRFREIELLRKKVEEEIRQKSLAIAKKAEKAMKTLPSEKELIEQGGKIYSQFSMGLRSAMPRSEKERKKDMQDLMEAVKILESFDREMYYTAHDREEDMGRGMFFDRITSKLYRLMRKEGLNKAKFVDFNKLVYLGLKNIKNITKNDLRDALRYMKEAAYIRDYVEVNPQLILVFPKTERIHLTNPEKVVLVCAQEQVPLTFKKLIEYTQWDEEHARNVIDGLLKKEIIEYNDDVITVPALETPEERKLREELEKQIEEEKKRKEKMREEQRRKLQEEYNKKIHTKTAEESAETTLEKELEKIIDKSTVEMKAKERLKLAKETAKADVLKKFKKPSVKALPSKKTEEKVGTSVTPKPVEMKPKFVPKPAREVELSPEELTEIDEELKEELKEEAAAAEEKMTEAIERKDEMEGLMEAIGKLDEMAKESAAAPGGGGEEFDLDSLSFDDLGDEIIDEEEGLSDEAIIEGVLTIYEKYEHLNGGLMDINFIYNLLKQIFADIQKIDLINVLDKLKEMGLVRDTVDLGITDIWLFKFDSSALNEDDIALIKEIAKSGPETVEDAAEALGWDKQKIESVLNRLKELEVVKIENNKIIFPGLWSETD